MSFSVADSDHSHISYSEGDDEQGVRTPTTETEQVDRRDEVGEVRKMSSKDTNRLRWWRIVVTGLLLLTAFAVTLTTYSLLKHQEDENFKTAVRISPFFVIMTFMLRFVSLTHGSFRFFILNSTIAKFAQFARTVGDAAVDQQQRMREAFVGFACLISASARRSNATWPMVRIPDYELYAGEVRRQSGAEIVTFRSFVEREKNEEYLKFVTVNYEDSVKESHMIRYGNIDRLTPKGYTPNYTLIGPTGFYLDTIDRDFRLPFWHLSPPMSTYYSINWDKWATVPSFVAMGKAMFELKNQTVYSPVRPYAENLSFTEEEHSEMHSTRRQSDVSYPHSFIYTPIHEIFNDYESKIVGVTGGGFAWDYELRFLLPNNAEGIIVEIRNTCNQSSLYELVGYDAFYLGENATRDAKYDKMEVVRDLTPGTHPNFTATPGHCRYSIHIFPSSKFQNEYKTNTPVVYAGVVAFTFVLVAVAFFIYDTLVQNRNEKIVVTAARSNAIVSSMFPDAIRDRLLQQNDEAPRQGHYKSYLLNDGEGDAGNLSSKPFADLFLEVTVIFADICGFTAWSSVRDPTQVFSLLEAVYSAFDTIANRRRVFKVETVGDCYVAVTGLPEARQDHAVAMALFARDIMSAMCKVTRKLELTLGPGTADLKLRVGLHSGPVTGGVLRGERSRFQLFGDTMNTTARIESTGASGCIHLSSITADLLKQAGKHSWVKQRDECVIAKGKGSMQTYWLTNAIYIRDDHTVGTESDRRTISSGHDVVINLDDFVVGTNHTGQVVTLCQQATRLIDWNVEQLLGLIRQMVARRSVSKLHPQAQTIDSVLVDHGMSPIHEVQEIITLPEFDTTANQQGVDIDDIEISPIVVEQLKAYVTWVASMYKQNPFHNFDHASHVVMSVIKLMSRIVAPTDQHINNNAATLHDHTYGITSDPLTQFACVFSALIHDVDHSGVPNTTLVSEQASIAAKYNNRSVAEQNSLDLAWNELMDEIKYQDLRAALFTDRAELIRFRKLAVNGVMATDIADRDLKTLRNNRWDKAFKVDPNYNAASPQEQRDAVNRKATIVIEHLIQASDVSHTMQHWHVFRKWNQALFEEMYEAYRAGRADKNPADFWYEGEIGFFDYYIIPLAKKLKDCGVFGVSSDEYLNYAMKNREEWEARGHEVVMEMMEAVANHVPKNDSASIVVMDRTTIGNSEAVSMAESKQSCFEV